MTKPSSDACQLCSRTGFLCSDLSSPIKTSAEVRNAFHGFGIAVRRWASDHGVHPNSVSEVIGGRKPSVRGDAHAIAVLLRLKDGDISEFLNSRAKGLRGEAHRAAVLLGIKDGVVNDAQPRGRRKTNAEAAIAN